MGTQSEQLEREAHQTRARLSETIEELRARMTPGQVVDQLTDYAREGPAAEFFRNLAREVRENPLPLTLIGTGVVWLIIASSRSSAARRAACDEAMAEISARTSLVGSAGRPEDRDETPALPAPEGAEGQPIRHENARALEASA